MSAPPRVLLVDDDPAFVTEAATRLKSRGFLVASTWNTDEALALLSKERFDAVLLDNGLPGRMGIVALPALAERGKTPILLMSAHPSDDLEVDAKLLGAQGFMPKPLDWDAVAARIRALARKS